MEDIDTSEQQQQQPLPYAQEPLVKAHSHLASISNLAHQCYNELVTHGSRHEQAYYMEQHKLTQSVAACKALELENDRLSRENRQYEQQILPSHNRMIFQQGQEIQRLQREAQDSDARQRALEEKRCEELEEHRIATEAMVELIRASDQKIKGLEDRIQELTAPGLPSGTSLRPRNTGKRARVGKSETAQCVGKNEHVKRSRRCKADRRT